MRTWVAGTTRLFNVGPLSSRLSHRDGGHYTLGKPVAFNMKKLARKVKQKLKDAADHIASSLPRQEIRPGLTITPLFDSRIGQFLVQEEDHPVCPERHLMAKLTPISQGQAADST